MPVMVIRAVGFAVWPRQTGLYRHQLPCAGFNFLKITVGAHFGLGDGSSSAENTIAVHLGRSDSADNASTENHIFSSPWSGIVNTTTLDLMQMRGAPVS